MTPSGLKSLYEASNPDGYFFCRENMKFAGDTMRNFGVYLAEVKDGLYEGSDTRPDMKAWCLYRKKPTRCGVGFVCAFDMEGNELVGYEVK